MLRCTWELIALGSSWFCSWAEKYIKTLKYAEGFLAYRQHDAFGSPCFIRCDIFSLLVKSTHSRFQKREEFNLTFSLVSLYFDKYSKKEVEKINSKLFSFQGKNSTFNRWPTSELAGAWHFHVPCTVPNSNTPSPWVMLPSIFQGTDS